MIWRAIFVDVHGVDIRESVYAAEDLEEAVALLANGTVDIPPDAAGLRLFEAAGV